MLNRVTFRWSDDLVSTYWCDSEDVPELVAAMSRLDGFIGVDVEVPEEYIPEEPDDGPQGWLNGVNDDDGKLLDLLLAANNN